MQTAKAFYEVGDNKDSSPIVKMSKHIHDDLLATFDPELALHSAGSGGSAADLRYQMDQTCSSAENLISRRFFEYGTSCLLRVFANRDHRLDMRCTMLLRTPLEAGGSRLLHCYHFILTLQPAE